MNFILFDSLEKARSQMSLQKALPTRRSKETSAFGLQPTVSALPSSGSGSESGRSLEAAQGLYGRSCSMNPDAVDGHLRGWPAAAMERVDYFDTTHVLVFAKVFRQMESLAVGILISLFLQNTGRLRKVMVHARPVLAFIVHFLAEQFAYQTGNTCVSLRCTDAGPTGDFFIQCNGNVFHAKIIVHHEIRVKMDLGAFRSQWPPEMPVALSSFIMLRSSSISFCCSLMASTSTAVSLS